MFRAALAFVVAFAVASTARADDTGDIKKELEAQLDLIKKGDVAELKKHFTARLQDSLTADAVKAAAKKAATVTLDDLAAKIEVTEAKGAKTAAVTMKNGRKLTTFVQTDGKWLADTVWFK